MQANCDSASMHAIASPTKKRMRLEKKTRNDLRNDLSMNKESEMEETHI
jgi:hypothetical protein